MFSWLEHVGEVELSIEASTEEAVFAEALAALRELVGEGEHGDVVFREIAVQGADRPALLAEWVSELVFLAEMEGFVAERIARLRLSGNGLDATVAGRLGTPPHLVKAVTYHRLTFERSDGLWHASAVLDV